jgi:hypothetical protein
MIEARKAVGRAAARARIEGRERDARGLEDALVRIPREEGIRDMALGGPSPFGKPAMDERKLP